MISSLNDLPEVASYLSRIGAEPRSLRSAVVRLNFGSYWKDLAIIRFKPDGTVDCDDPSLAPTSEEVRDIKAAFRATRWPEPIRLKRLTNLHPMIEKADPKNLFVFKNLDDEIVMVQVRVNRKGDKAYIPFTYWSDEQWRIMEPDGPLPLYNAHRLRDAPVVFIHEGAKAARYAQWMVDSETDAAREALAQHPWGRELAAGVHIGWIGGALSPRRTDWSEIAKVGIPLAYIVADNDSPGRAAVPKIAEQLRIPTFTLQFTDEFPASFDLADKFPENMFREMDGQRIYTGPMFRECQHPATWMTDLVQINPRGRPTAVLRDSAREMWVYVEEADNFICKPMPDIRRNEQILNKMLAPFSDVRETAQLIVKEYRGRSPRVCYRPDEKGLLVTYRGSSAINLHVPSSIEPLAGDPSPWLEFLQYLFVNPNERREAMRWLATLIARPDIRMAYGLLLISESQGIGKSTLGSNVLAPLVGPNNTGFPGESDINSDYTDWVAMKRLAVISEIYSGASWKIYHRLKSIVTDKEIMVNEKYMRQYTIDNWCHILACSNSMRALKIEQDDRRWFYPECAEVPWPEEKFTAFRQWLVSGGLSIIKHWAQGFGDYVSPAARAPMTDRKKDMIDGSRSEAQREATEIAEAMAQRPVPVGISLKDVVGWCRNRVQGRVHDTDYELRKSMADAGLKVWPKRIKVGPRLDYIICNEPLFETVRKVQEATDQNQILRTHLKTCGEIMEAEL